MDLTGRRTAIVGTAQSWKQTPWTDPGLYIISLNDAYRMNGFVRADAWYDFHPLDRFFSIDKGQPLHAHQVPAGFYCRPTGHREWLGVQPIPVYLHPEYVTQHAAAKDWPTARAFPKAAIEAHFGRYFTSSPAWMLAHLLLQGAREIAIYGIHLSTQQEYLEQRPQFEWLIGRVLGPRKLTTIVKDGMRWYQTADAVVALPEASPVLTSDFQYAFETRPSAHLAPLQWDLHRFTVKRERAVAALKTRKWWHSSSKAQAELWQWETYLADTQEQLARQTAPWR